MAKILLGDGVKQISGTTGGSTYQNWRGMQIIREKPTPHNPQTARQTEIRAITSSISTAFREELNQGQRNAWNQRAKTYPWFNVFGRSITMSGINLFLKQNFILLDHGLPRQDMPVAMVEPPDLANITLGESTDRMDIEIPQLTSGIITAQAPFLVIKIAGGFTEIVITPPPPPKTIYEATIHSQALPQGKVHQESDFRHAVYLDDTSDDPDEDTNKLSVNIPGMPAVRNVVISITRFNQYGNFTPPRIFNKIITAE